MLVVSIRLIHYTIYIFATSPCPVSVFISEIDKLRVNKRLAMDEWLGRNQEWEMVNVIESHRDNNNNNNGKVNANKKIWRETGWLSCRWLDIWMRHSQRDSGMKEYISDYPSKHSTTAKEKYQRVTTTASHLRVCERDKTQNRKYFDKLQFLYCRWIWLFFLVVAASYSSDSIQEGKGYICKVHVVYL